MYRKEIDGLRAIAVLAVILNHFDKKILPGGFLGVDIFYVLSGFVITASLSEKKYISFREYTVGFWTRRIKRLAPALFLCVSITLLLTFLFSSPQIAASFLTLHTGIFSLFGLSNLFLYGKAADYFSTIAELNAFTHTWSLGVEEQFYLVFPFLTWISGFVTKRKNGVRNFLILLSILSSISVIYYIKLSFTNPVKAFYLMPTRFWELALGSISFLLSQKVSTEKKRNGLFLDRIVSVCFASILILLCLPQSGVYSEFSPLPVVLSTSVLLFAVEKQFLTARFLSLKPFVYMGTISYSLYLWHWSVLSVSRWTIGVNLWTAPFQLTFIFLFAIVSHKFLERPLRYSDWPELSIGPYFKIGPIGYFFMTAALISSVTLFVVIPRYTTGKLYLGKWALLEKKGVETLQDDDSHDGFEWKAKSCILSSNDEVGKKILPQNCSFGNFKEAKRRFLVIGNSFSAAEIEMFKILESSGEGAVMITSSWGAAPVPNVDYKGHWDEANRYYWNEVIPELIGKLRPEDVVLMINDGAPYSPETFTKSSAKNLNVLENGLESFIRSAAQKGLFVVYQSANPMLRESNCTPDLATPQSWHVFGEPPCNYYSRQTSLRRRKEYHDLLLRLRDKHDNFFVLDLFDVFCPSELCRFYDDNGVFLYRDEFSHPSVEAGRLSQPELLKTIRSIPFSKR
ncbi:acyltransferase [Leptospira gomenensis]|uniref:Acyltransferase n=1 Tax=Leptospira gomenensis TaxID=2484974 RepID=A0A5F1YCX7_9LEPT|nr:acyltransferase family protein [Leptospira gomenensis]TGK33202.1 acyltransferase [Leptospira gomenensis]TGK35565.1 acyltransferase [Leptospira gomenensis]TGK40889.1 acyltransferase [Leptospira gomenensis]TGK61179.1 acyltransferase [Leptospira gomenensis]